MKKHLNTLFVTAQNAYIHKEGECIVVKLENDEKKRFPIHMFESLVCIGNISCSAYVLEFCSSRNVSVSFLSESGRFLARVSGPVHGNVLLRRQQYRMADDNAVAVKIARNIVFAKILNARLVVNRALRDHTHDGEIKEEMQRVSAHLKMSADKVVRSDDMDIIRGIEGESAQEYFCVFNHLIVSQKDDFIFHHRSRRPPRDFVNALLSYVYTILMHDVRSALETVGLDPSVGFLHCDRPGRYSLSLDMMEEFRPFFADRLVLSLINLKQVKRSGFQTTESGAIYMDATTRKELLTNYQRRKQDTITHPFLDETVTIGRLFHIQAMLLSRFIRGDLDGYPPYIWR